MALPCKNIVCYLLSLLYGVIVGLRNFFFNKGWLPSVQFDFPIIAIGNLAVGGTGKTPHTEFLLKILRPHWETAVLSRGYKRETRGFYLADKNANAQTIGDEPYQIWSKFPDSIVAVDEKRVHGIRELLKHFPTVQAFLLDDAFQHRQLRPGLSILLTDYARLFSEDRLLPYGWLRERPENSRRADIIIVTKCPLDAEIDKEHYRSKLNLQADQLLFFSSFDYLAIYPVFSKENQRIKIENDMTVFLITGIEQPAPMICRLKQYTTRIIHYAYPDHHEFSEADLYEVEHKFNQTEGKKIILTTEKDAARLKSMPQISDVIKNNLFAQPLEVKILLGEEELFIQKIYDYVRTDSTNR